MLRINSAMRKLERCFARRPVAWDSQPPQILHYIQNDIADSKLTDYQRHDRISP